ncbi:site-specific integrase [Hymenobacter sp. BRD128]|uniref:phage integrase SAM-like domain-containing protein n=1 Tax=Hymenobacter sp. BRD128 TaxID=2675878 RepID=UPI0015661A4C|nr:phage integrase SAM-like domain-containing protein [Hymenobacter sp. BRD128]QKG56972.1 site-specific integrase [Hymenobacter sp. BRD128]
MQYTFRQLTSRPDSQGRCRVLLDVTWEGYREKLATGVRCQPAHFDADAKPGRLIAKAEPGSSGLNTKLAGLVADLSDLFNKAEAHRQPVRREQVLALVRPAAPEAGNGPVAPPDPLLTDLLQQWEHEHPQSSPDAKRRWRQVAGHLEAYHQGLRVSQLTKPFYVGYLAYLHALELSDSTIGKNISFLRACLRLAEKHIPTWLTVKVRQGRPVSLRREELQQLASYRPTLPSLVQEQQRVLFQAQLLLRDSDLRRLQPHHVSEQDLAGVGRVLVLEFHQKKTGDEVRLPLPPLAAAIWRQWQGRVPVISLQKRNEHIKELAEAAGLSRTFVRVRFRAGKPVEEPLPLHQVVSTHTPRHVGADMVLWGSGGDHNLKEAALGHLGGASVYGYDTLERYGPLFLNAWGQVGALDFLHPEKDDN